MLRQIEAGPLLNKIALAAGLDVRALPDGPRHMRLQYRGQGHLAVESVVGGYVIVRRRWFRDAFGGGDWDTDVVAWGSTVYACRAEAERVIAVLM